MDAIRDSAEERELESDEAPPLGCGLCLSGGGYRAMLFHAGSLKRLNELGLLAKVDRISSVSGGSIAAAVLGVAWTRLAFDESGVATNFDELVLQPLRGLARRTIDVPAVLLRFCGVWRLSDSLVRAYDKNLFRGRTLQDLPDHPRFVINATNLQSGALWRFSKPYMRDWRVGMVKAPRVLLAVAVAASSAFPPFLSPVILRLKASDFEPGTGEDCQRGRFLTRVALSDGGVYDNLGLETLKRCKTVLVSNAGGRMPVKNSVPVFWPFQAKRLLDVVDNQVRSLRVRWFMESLGAGGAEARREGAYWSIRGDFQAGPVEERLWWDQEEIARLAGLPTRLKAYGEGTQEALVRWGRAAADAAVREQLQNLRCEAAPA